MIQAAFNSFLVALLMIPAATLLCRRDSRMRRLPSLLLLFVLLVGALVAGVSFWRGDRLALDLSWATPFPFALTVDRLSAFFLLLICAVGAPVPVLHASALFGVGGDFILLVYLLAIGKFFLMLGALDGGSSFGGLGASREALVSALAEAPLLLALTAVAILTHTISLSGIVLATVSQSPFHLSAVYVFAFGALALVAIAETGRIPVDNPSTHLELTMIHEAMVLEYSGPSLALIEWASAIKLTLIMALLVGVFGPWGMAVSGSIFAVVLAPLAFVLKLAVLTVAIAVIESSIAKLRMYLVPDFLGMASALAILAVAFTALMR